MRVVVLSGDPGSWRALISWARYDVRSETQRNRMLDS